ncbi:MAG TPA: glycosyltransferase family 39 protein [Streptosporangiaceae bacterium]|nr:glycosyltransferase family 39 protein [Streptosporangiaceae bacterium]
MSLVARSAEPRAGRLRGAARHTGEQRAEAVPASGAAPVNRWVIAVGAAAFAVEMALSARYGFHRDELYFLDSGRHLQASYVDQPVLTPLIARVSLWLFGLSLVGLHLWPALAGWATVVAGGLTAREFGGGRRAQLLAAIATATMPTLLAVDHLLGPTAFDMLAWAGLAFVAARIGRTGDCRWWLAGGGVLGLGLANKHSVGFFGIALLTGALLSGGRQMMLNRWFAAGVVIAVAFTIPDLWWQAQHQWATIAMTKVLNQENGGLGNVGNWVIGQLVMTSLAMVVVWAAGLRFLWRSGRPLWQALAWAYGLLFVFFALTSGAKIYYLAGAYVYLLAAGAVAIDGWLAARPGRLRRLLVATGITTAVALPAVLPVLPAADIGWTAKVNPVPVESAGWPQLVGTVHHVWASLPPRQRASAVIFAADYGEAGAIDELGRGTGLPTVVSGHNTYWWWGPGNPHATTVVAVAPGPEDVTGYGAYLSRFFTGVKVAATLSNPYGLHNEEWGGHVYICTGPRHPWGQIWPRLRHYG